MYLASRPRAGRREHRVLRPGDQRLPRSSKTLAGIAEYSPITLLWSTITKPSALDVGLVTGNYFCVMGLSPILGRSFGPQRRRQAAPRRS